MSSRRQTPSAGRKRSLRGRAGFTLIEVLWVTILVGVLSAIAIVTYKRAVVRAQIAAVAAEGKILYNAFNTYHVDHGTYPSGMALDSFDPLRSGGYFGGSMTDLLEGGAADGYGASGTEFWVQMTLKADPSVQFVVASSDESPLGGSTWIEGVYMFKNGEHKGAFENR